jgi:hypothetical protein
MVMKTRRNTQPAVPALDAPLATPTATEVMDILPTAAPLNVPTEVVEEPLLLTVSNGTTKRQAKNGQRQRQGKKSKKTLKDSGTEQLALEESAPTGTTALELTLPETDGTPKLHNTRATNNPHPGCTAGLEKRFQADIARVAAEKREQKEAEARQRQLEEEAQKVEVERKCELTASYKAYLEAKRRWREAMASDFDSVEDHEAIDLVDTDINEVQVVRCLPHIISLSTRLTHLSAPVPGCLPGCEQAGSCSKKGERQ